MSLLVLLNRLHYFVNAVNDDNNEVAGDEDYYDGSTIALNRDESKWEYTCYCRWVGC